MSTAKQTLSLVIIAVGFVCAAFIYAAGKLDALPALSEKTEEVKDAKQTAAVINNAFSDDMPQVEDLPNATSAEFLSSGTNITELFAKFWAKTIVDHNPLGPTLYSNQQAVNVPNNIDVKEFVKESRDTLTGSGYAFETSTIDAQKLMGQQEISVVDELPAKRAELEAYFSDLHAILYAIKKNTPFDQNSFEDNMRVLAIAHDLAASYAEAIRKLTLMKVPAELADFHKDELNLVTAKKEIFEKVAGGAADPLGALVAASEMQKIDTEFQNLTVRASVFIYAHGLFKEAYN